MLTHHQLKRATALALALGAVLPAVAAARPIDDPAIARNQAPATVYSRPQEQVIPVTSPTNSAPQPIVRVETPASGFDWGDAGIGAAGGLAVAMLGVGGGLVISHQRPRRTRHTTSLPN